ncbi:MAG: tRNA (adenosine(37)-N6)-threonylcarbamoyltransferase complex dimerization subunit type 1 TsaB [bacterium]|nr:tRNA (adenosine(37)-N6)-threonylcarbamoyltransferase complex dimerization subunit type 1 TsaB [bacterium]
MKKLYDTNMTLYINTTEAKHMIVALKQGRALIAEKKVKAMRQEAEKLLPAVKALLKAEKIDLKQLKKIEVESRGGSFTSLRIGVVTANALAYALGVPVAGSQKPEVRSKKLTAVEPIYDREPEITKKKMRLLRRPGTGSSQ